jgi:type IV pilus assembly protein PilC
MVKTAEATGDLEGTLDDMAAYYSNVEKTRKEMKSALTYPILILLFAFGVVAFILLYLVPQFEGIYQSAGANVNKLTAFIIAASKFLKNYIVSIIIGVILFIIVLVVLYKKVKSVRYYMQKFAMKLPVFGNMIIYKEITIFTRTFANLLKNNVFITESMDILVKITNNEIYKQIMINTVNYIGRGDKISEAFKNNWAIPEVAYYMMQTGESTGQLAEMMEKVADYFDTQHKTLVDTMKSLIEPVLILFLAVVVGGIIISIIMPMFGLYSELM